jgi:hypothetical protein
MLTKEIQDEFVRIAKISNCKNNSDKVLIPLKRIYDEGYITGDDLRCVLSEHIYFITSLFARACNMTSDMLIKKLQKENLPLSVIDKVVSITKVQYKRKYIKKK